MSRKSARTKVVPFERGNGRKARASLDGELEQFDDFRDRRYVKNVAAKSANQKLFMDAMRAHGVTLALGPAGTGKTYLAVSAAVDALNAGDVARIVLSRPAIEAGENIGFLPGTMAEKLAPYLRPLYDALCERIGGKTLKTYLAEGVVEIAPIAYMRGRTLNNCFIVVDEAQNCTYAQIKMILTRLGYHSTMVVTGDPEQSDLLPGISGLPEIARRLECVPRIAQIHFTREDVVRHPLVSEMLEAL